MAEEDTNTDFLGNPLPRTLGPEDFDGDARRLAANLAYRDSEMRETVSLGQGLGHPEAIAINSSLIEHGEEIRTAFESDLTEARDRLGHAFGRGSLGQLESAIDDYRDSFADRQVFDRLEQRYFRTPAIGDETMEWPALFGETAGGTQGTAPTLSGNPEAFARHAIQELEAHAEAGDPADRRLQDTAEDVVFNLKQLLPEAESALDLDREFKGDTFTFAAELIAKDAAMPAEDPEAPLSPGRKQIGELLDQYGERVSDAFGDELDAAKADAESPYLADQVRGEENYAEVAAKWFDFHDLEVSYRKSSLQTAAELAPFDGDMIAFANSLVERDVELMVTEGLAESNEERQSISHDLSENRQAIHAAFDAEIAEANQDVERAFLDGDVDGVEPAIARLNQVQVQRDHFELVEKRYGFEAEQRTETAAIDPVASASDVQTLGDAQTVARAAMNEIRELIDAADSAERSALQAETASVLESLRQFLPESDAANGYALSEPAVEHVQSSARARERDDDMEL
ncbi:MAG: hypothetical protein AAGF48_15650 [Pseudomonadota bacterium]